MTQYFKDVPASARRRLASAVLLLGLLGAAKITYDAAPRAQSIHLHLHDDLRANLGGIRLTYLEDNEAISGTEQRFKNRPPEVLTSAPSLSPGDYELDIELSDLKGQVTHVRHRVTVPTEGSLQIRVRPDNARAPEGALRQP
jgi:hypothetical protein